MIKLGDQYINNSAPCFIIAEAGVNHNGDINLAYKIIDAAKKSGANAVKFQTYKTEKLVTTVAEKAKYQTRGADPSETQFQMLKKFELSETNFENVYQYCQQKNILFLSSPFDDESIEFLDRLGIIAFKIPSGEINNYPYLKTIAKKQKPIILSTGMSDLEEVENAVDILKENGNGEIILLHCVSNYPTDPEDVNLRAMKTMSTTFGLPVGYSDHTEGIEIPIAAAALGACVIEKHFTLDKHLEGPDHATSLEPSAFTAMVEGIRNVESAMGNGIKKPSIKEADIAKVVRKSLVAKENLASGTVLDRSMIEIKRPGTGLPPGYLEHVIGRKLRIDVKAGSVLTLEMFQ